MEWEGRRESGNVEDRRSFGPKGLAIGGGGSILLVILALVFGFDPQALLQQAPQGDPAAGQGQPNPEQDKVARFAKVILADTEDVWKEQFRLMRKTYREPTLVLFNGRVESACGLASSAVGPFYCPGDHNVYLDLTFFDELSQRFGAKGDFAQAYVVAHEVGHHVQNLLGTTARVESARSKTERNQLSVRLELQADFFAGLWAHHGQKTKQFLQKGDIEEAIRCANAIGDDRLQKQSQGYVVPDSFTHGTAAQRARWFLKGFETGDMRQGNTFDLPYNQL